MATKKIFNTKCAEPATKVGLFRFIPDFRTVRKSTFICLCLATGTAMVLLASSCASTSVKGSWKSPDFKGEPPRKVAVIADDERKLVRVALENRFVNQLVAASQPAFGTASSFPDLEAARKNKEVTVAQLRAAGADAILITKLVSKSDYQAKAQQRFTGHYVAVTVTPGSDSWDTSVGSFDTYQSGPRSDDRSYLLLDTSLFDLNTGRRIWGCITETTIRQTDDRLEIADEFVGKVIEVMRQDGMIR